MHGRTPVRTRGRHFLRSRSLAARWIDQADITCRDLVVEVGAGSGMLTEPLARRAAAVWAIELDAKLAGRLERRFRGSNVQVIQGDALVVALPDDRYRVFGNIPWHITTALLRRLLGDPQSGPFAVDLLVGLGAATRLTRPSGSLVALCWAPWWLLRAGPRIDRDCFSPPPSGPGAILSVRRRERALLAPDARAHFEATLRRAFSASASPVARTLREDLSRAGVRALRRRAVPVDAPPTELTLAQWLAVYRAAQARERPVTASLH